MARRRKSRKDRAVRYRLAASGWEIAYSDGGGESRDAEGLDEHLSIVLHVSLAEPVKGVTGGLLYVYRASERTGGMLEYKGDRLGGAVWTSELGTAALLAALIGGKRVGFELLGGSFFYRRARIDSVAWFTDGHADFEDQS
jgi:hypothetical protein